MIMKQISLLFATLFVAAALAGCATNDPDADADPTPTTATPTDATPTPTPTPTPTTDPVPPTTDDDTDPHPEEPVECPAPPTTDAAPGERLGFPEITYTVSEPDEDNECFAFVGPATASAGWTVMTLQNNGMAPHIMPMFFLSEDHTYEDFVAALATGEEPEWAVPVGGVGVATPFSKGSSIIELQEGTYVVVCFFEGHHIHGMHRPLIVTANEAEPVAAPVADLEFVLHDYSFEVPENLTAGTYIARFTNHGAEPHEAPLIALNPGTTMEEFLEAIENPNAQGPPPGAGVGGVNVVAPGGEAFAILELEAGDYGTVCFVESDAHDGAPHVALGMVTQFTVAPADEAAE